jgi:hypothetical protein
MLITFTIHFHIQQSSEIRPEYVTWRSRAAARSFFFFVASTRVAACPILSVSPSCVNLLRVAIVYASFPCNLFVCVSFVIDLFLLPRPKPRPDNMTMTMNHETHTFRHARGTHAAFTTGRDKWFYGVLLHNIIGWLTEDDCGTFLLEDGHVETYNIKLVDAATLRLQKDDFAISQYSPYHSTSVV